MRAPLTLRARLVGLTVGLLALGLLLFGGGTLAALDVSLTRRLDDQLAGAVPAVLADLGRAGPRRGGPADPRLPAGAYAQLRTTAGEVLRTESYSPTPAEDLRPVRLPDRLPAGGGPFTARSRDGDEYRVLVREARGLQLVVAAPLDENRRILATVAAIGVTVAGLLLVLLSGLAWWTVTRGLRPLADVGRTADAISAGDLSRRVPHDDPRTEVGRMGRALNTMLDRMHAALESRQASEARMRRFLADASHELRTPLTSIRGYAELFRRGADRRPEDLATAMRRIEDEAARMGLLVDELLLLARVDEGRPLARDPVDLAEVVAEACAGAAAADPNRELRLSASGPVPVVGDAARLHQAVSNLLANTRVHTPAGTPVEVEVSAVDGRARVSVADRGPGLDAEGQARAFERFWRADEARHGSTGGTGLGLAVVASVARAHGGSAGVHPRDGGGAVFTLDVPLAPTGLA